MKSLTPFLRTLIISFLVVLVVGGGLAYFGLKKVQQIRDEREATANSLKRQDISVTLVEGKRREETGFLLQEKGICTFADFMAASEGKEGTLFPDTYRFFPNTPASEVVTTLTNNYAKKVASLAPTQEQLILASIVEREAKKDVERPIVASIYQNRIDIGMKLEADPTVQYSKDNISLAAGNLSTDFKFWNPIVQADYQKVQSPYNTYINAGLPPGPIDSPGIKSIEAAVNPANTEYYYLYYNEAGDMLPAKTFSEHLKNQE